MVGESEGGMQLDHLLHWIRVYGWKRTIQHAWEDYISVVLVALLVWGGCVLILYLAWKGAVCGS